MGGDQQRDADHDLTDIDLFAHRLALALGHADVDRMLDSMPAVQFMRWVAFYKDEPWGRLADDMLMATMCSMYQATHRGNKPPMLPSDFLPYYDDGLDDLTRSLIRATST